MAALPPWAVIALLLVLSKQPIPANFAVMCWFKRKFQKEGAAFVWGRLQEHNERQVAGALPTLFWLSPRFVCSYSHIRWRGEEQEYQTFVAIHPFLKRFLRVCEQNN